MSGDNGNGRPKHFNYDEIKAWEASLRRHGIWSNIGYSFQGHNIVQVKLEIVLKPGDTLPVFPGVTIEEPKRHP